MPTAIISRASSRYQNWIQVFGVDRVPVVSATPQRGRVPDQDDDAQLFQLDLTGITAEQRSRLVAHISKRFNLPAAEIEELLEQDFTKGGGVPILADDVTIVNHVDVSFL